MKRSAFDAVPDPQEAPPLRWGVMAPGGIARTFVRAVQRHTRSDVVAVGSRSAERAADFAAEYDIARSHGSYEALAADEDVQAVYVASPHSRHAEQALLAIAAGKHVLVEKAFTRNRAEAEQVLAAAEAAGVFVMEAMWTRHLPHMVELQRLVADGAVGEVVAVEADHGQALPTDPTHRLQDPEQAGGALLDLGVYPLAFILDVLGAPSSVTAAGVLTDLGVDGQVAAALGYADQPGQRARAQAVAHTTMWAKTPNRAAVSGTAGRIEVEGVFYAPSAFTLIRPDADPLHVDGRIEDGFRYQIAEVARRVEAGEQQSPRMTWQHTRELMAVMDEIRRQVGVVYPGE